MKAEGPPVPSKPDEMTWRDYAILLLHVASGIEHALMVQYLYAAYSLDATRMSTPRQREQVAQWQESLLKIAKEEMGHLLSVQNVLTLLGGPVTLEREDFPWDSEFYPFPFRLEPLTLGSLACYVFTEMPEGGHDDLPDKERREIIRRVNEHVRGHDPKAQLINDQRDQPHHVGKLYTLIIDILKDTDLVPEAEFRMDTFAGQASWDAWGRGYKGGLPPGTSGDGFYAHEANVLVEQMPTRQSAVAALLALAGQGEASHLKETADPSHFERFLEIYEAYVDMGDAALASTRQIPVNPVVPVAGVELGPAFTPIGCPRSAAWATLFNLRYRMLLTYLGHAFRLSRVRYTQKPNLSGSIMHRVFAEMYNIKTIATILARRPLTDPPDRRRAGPPFQLPYTLAMPVIEIDCWRLHRGLLQSSGEICASLSRIAADGESGPDEAAYLASLIEADGSTQAWVDQVVAGLDINGSTH